ncbi:autotransporter domain-containing protein [Duodenibacillus massiliensis]|uniref:autotransporter domain-containing protein n=1 Tax=Duodenibacillus massiliensis TaxID=1852381 RepID=UPI003AEF635D
MNKSFKVVFSKARSALMVVNEATSSIQAKGTKTVIAAAAAAMIAGGAMAAQSTEKTIVIDTDTTVAGGTWSAVTGAKQESVTIKAGTVKLEGYNDAYDVQVLGGSVVIDGSKNTGTWDKAGLVGYNAVKGASGDEPTDSKTTLVKGATVTITDSANFGVGAHAKEGYKDAKFVFDGAQVTLAGSTNAKASVIFAASSNEEGNAVTLALTNGTTLSVAKDKFGVLNTRKLVVDNAAINVNGSLSVGAIAQGADTATLFADNANKTSTATFTNSTVNVGASGMFYMDDATLEDTAVTNAGTLGLADLTVKNSTLTNAAKATLDPDTLTMKSGKLVNAGTFGTTADTKKVTIGNTDVLNGAAVVENSGKFNAKAVVVDGDGAFTNTAAGELIAGSVEINKGGKLTTAISTTTKGADGKETKVQNYQVAQTTVNEGGELAVTALNSEKFDGIVIYGNTTSAAKLTLNGGQVTYQGKVYQGNLKLGSKDAVGQLTLGNGDYKLDTLSVWHGTITENGSPVKSTATIGKNATLTVNALDLTKGVLVNDGTLTVTGTATAQAGATVTNTGTINVGVASLISKVEGANSSFNATATEFGKAAGTAGGTIVDTTRTTAMKIGELNAIKKALGITDSVKTTLLFANSSLVANDGKNLTFSAVDGTKSLNTVATSDNAAVTFSKDSMLGALAFDSTKVTTDVTITGPGSGAVVLAGDASGNVFTGVASGKAVNVSGNVKLGAGIDGVADAKAINVANKLVVGQAAKLGIDTSVTAKDITNSGAITVTGSLAAASLAGGTVTLTGGDLYVAGTAPKAETRARTFALRAAAPSAEETPKYETAFAVETKVGTQGTTPNFVVFGTTDTAVKAKALKALESAEVSGSTAVLYVDKHLSLASGAVALGAQAPTSNGTLTSDINTAVVIDTQAIAAHNYAPTEGLFTGVTANNGTLSGNVVLTNLTNKAFTKNADGSFSMLLGDNVTVGADKVATDAGFYIARFDAASKSLVVAADETELQNLKDAGVYIAGAVAQDVRTMTNSGNQLVRDVIYGNAAHDAFRAAQDAKIDALAENGKALVTEAGIDNAYFNTQKNRFDTTQLGDATLKAQLEALNAQMDAIENAAGAYEVASLNAAANMAVAGGAFTTALDINDQVTATLNRRTSLANLNVSRAEVGITPWVDVFGTTNEAKRLYGSNAGYEADIYGAVLGFDYTASCGSVIGLALNVGTADGNSVGDGVKVDNDTDFYGVSLYAARQFGDFNVQADLGYTQTSNDLKTNGAYGAYSESLDADVFTFGVGTEFLASAGMVNVVPHAGIRLTTIDMDASKFGADYDKMTVYQLPLGVTFSGNFEAAGFKVAPMVDVSVVPTFGDKDAVASFIGQDVTTRVVDTNPVQAKLGVTAQSGAWTFGINYGLTAGGDDRMNNSLNANVRYTF